MDKLPRSHYERLQSDDDDEDLPPQVHITAPGGEGIGRNSSSRWNHIENLDDFFIRVYDYHQQNGFLCILVKECFELAQYVFIVLFTTFLIFCVDYNKLFRDKDPVIIDCINFNNVKNANGVMILFLLIAFLFWTIRATKVFLYFFKLLEIKNFYRDALNISEDKLASMQWKDVQERLIVIQNEHQMCVHKANLTELDIYHRILRWKNYLIAMQNKGVLSCTYTFPIIGKRAFLTEGMKYNLNLLLFWGPDSPFLDSWKLKPEYKLSSERLRLAKRSGKDVALKCLLV
ncbi:autophagy-related protein 9A-like [Xenia sp. Carnegie-2017]|uniref:autophagy-related protein 9A-like n=1 Tax=Xenia sp. Carnegie-2017 TaxID=2897299 RepID=UPI001F04E9D3|nr:autophagy-related protein 9A-like [Xenia sp. Carnegie-2017]